MVASLSTHYTAKVINLIITHQCSVKQVEGGAIVRKIAHFMSIIIILCCFSAVAIPDISQNDRKHIQKFEKDFNYVKVDHRALKHGSDGRISIKPSIIIAEISETKRPPIVLSEFKNVDREPDFRVQSPRQNLTDGAISNICSISA